MTQTTFFLIPIFYICTTATHILKIPFLEFFYMGDHLYWRDTSFLTPMNCRPCRHFCGLVRITTSSGHLYLFIFICIKVVCICMMMVNCMLMLPTKINDQHTNRSNGRVCLCVLCVCVGEQGREWVGKRRRERESRCRDLIGEKG